MKNRPHVGRETERIRRSPPTADSIGAPDHQRTLAIPPGLSLEWFARSTHHTIPSPYEQRSHGTLRSAGRVDDAPHQLIAHWTKDGSSVTVDAWGPEAERFSLRAEDLLGFSDSTAGDFAPTSEPVAGWHSRTQGFRLPKNLSVFDSLIPIILAQRIVGKEAVQIQRRMFRRYAETAPGPSGLLVHPSPDSLREIGYERWHQMGLERKRAQLIHRCAAMADRLESWRDLETEEFYRRLTSIPGIGAWSANRLLYALGHADAVWIGDYNLPSFVAWNLAGEARADDRRMLELLEPFRGHRARVLSLMELHGSHPPRFGPRLALRNIQRH